MLLDIKKLHKTDMRIRRIYSIFVVFALVIFYFKGTEAKGKGKGKGGGGGGKGDQSTSRTNTSQDSNANNPSTGTTVGSTNTNATRSNTVAANAGFIMVGSVETHPNNPRNDKPFQRGGKSVIHNKTSSWLSRVFSGMYNKLFGSKKMVENKKAKAKSEAYSSKTADIDTSIEAGTYPVGSNPQKR